MHSEKAKDPTTTTTPERGQVRPEKDVGQDWHRISLDGIEYMGPGTHLEKRFKRGDPGINRLDKIAKQHGIDYSKAKNL